MDGRGDVSHQSDYSFIDTRAVLGKSYYRIVQVDRASSDGESNTSKSRIVTVDNQFGESILVFPNPSGNTINITSPLTRVLSWDLVNILGSIVKSGDEIAVDLSGLPDGAYFLKLKTHEGVVVKRFVKSGSKK